MSREAKTKPDEFARQRKRHKNRQFIVDTVKLVNFDGVPRWVTLGSARLLLGKYEMTSDFEDILFVFRGRIWAARCSSRKCGSDDRALSDLSGAPYPYGIRTNVKVLASVLQHHPR